MCHGQGEYARDDDGDGFHEVHVNTLEGVHHHPSKNGYTFEPVSRTVNVPPDVSEADFTGYSTLTYAIAGQVTDSNDNPIAGVTVMADTGDSVVTDLTEAYTLTGLLSGTYTITPSKSLYTFNPPVRTVGVPPDAVGQDFRGYVPGKDEVRPYLPIILR